MEGKRFRFKASNKYGILGAKDPHKQHGVDTGACGPRVLDEFEFKVSKESSITFRINLKGLK